MKRGEARGLASTLVKLQEDQRIKIEAVTDAIMAAYELGIADGRRDRITLSQDADTDQSAQA